MSEHVDLRHHGDSDVRPGLVDLAVNVRAQGPPAWLAAELARPETWAAYPDPTGATRALAAAHGVRPEQVLPTAGGTEGFALVARALVGRDAVVVHPQFTEPEVALAREGAAVRRVGLRPEVGFALTPAAVAEIGDADLVMIGNPTNPTGVLHPAAALRALRRPGRVVVVDEAFMDAVVDESESVLRAPHDLTGVIVLRSLTKTWAIAGLRAGYAVGDAALIARLAAQQSPWSVSTPAAVAMVATSTPAARAEAAAIACKIAADRAELVAALAGTSARIAAESAAPFLLLDTAAWGPESIREPLATLGFAVRRGETFPGLGPAWIRVAVRAPAVSRAFAAALGLVGGSG